MKPGRVRGRQPPRVALALAGGGPLGAIYEIGALCALQDALPDLPLTGLRHYVGVSAGGFVASGLANGIAPRAMCAAFIEDGNDQGDLFDPAWLTVPAWGEFRARARRLPGLAVRAAWQAGWHRKPLPQVLEGMASVLPTGLFSSEQVHRRLEAIFAKPGRTNDFRRLPAQLTLLATELDSGRPVAFGTPGWNHVPISRAVQATCALPGLFPPVRIDGRDFVDGALAKTMHASAALAQGADLLLCVNPLVPCATPGLQEGGLPAVLGQTFRTMIHSRLALGMKHYAQAWPGADIVLVEPDPRDAELLLANPFSYGQRRRLAEHAYQRTRARLLQDAAQLQPTFARHGLALDVAGLQAPRSLLAPHTGAARLGSTLARLEHALDTLDARLRTA